MQRKYIMLTLLAICFSCIFVSGCTSDQATGIQEIQTEDSVFTINYTEDREEITVLTRTFVPAYLCNQRADF